MDEPFASVQRGGVLQSAGAKKGSTHLVYLQGNKMSKAIPGLSLWGLLEWGCDPLCILAPP